MTSLVLSTSLEPTVKNNGAMGTAVHITLVRLIRFRLFLTGYLVSDSPKPSAFRKHSF